MFLLGPSSDIDEIRVNAIYEMDFVTPSNRLGTYASVRRYVNDTLTHYYDIFYAPGDGDAFHPPYVTFEHQSRQLAGEGVAFHPLGIHHPGLARCGAVTAASD